MEIWIILTLLGFTRWLPEYFPQQDRHLWKQILIWKTSHCANWQFGYFETRVKRSVWDIWCLFVLASSAGDHSSPHPGSNWGWSGICTLSWLSALGWISPIVKIHHRSLLFILLLRYLLRNKSNTHRRTRSDPQWHHSIDCAEAMLVYPSWKSGPTGRRIF